MICSVDKEIAMCLSMTELLLTELHSTKTKYQTQEKLFVFIID